LHKNSEPQKTDRKRGIDSHTRNPPVFASRKGPGTSVPQYTLDIIKGAVQHSKSKKQVGLMAHWSEEKYGAQRRKRKSEKGLTICDEVPRTGRRQGDEPKKGRKMFFATSLETGGRKRGGGWNTLWAHQALLHKKRKADHRRRNVWSRN